MAAETFYDSIDRRLTITVMDDGSWNLFVGLEATSAPAARGKARSPRAHLSRDTKKVIADNVFAIYRLNREG